MTIERKENRKANSHGKLIIFSIVGLVALLIFTCGIVLAKYITETPATGYVSASNFYFTSNLLDESPNTTTYTLNPGNGGTTSFSFEVRNYADELRISENDIAFNIKVIPEDGISIKVDDTPVDSWSNSTTNVGTLNKGNRQSSKITVEGLKNGTEYTIAAIGNAGFESELSAVVTVKPDVATVYQHVYNHTNYVLLTVWTKNLSGDVSVTFPNALIPDNTDPVMSLVLYGGGDNTTFTDGTNFGTSYSSHVYRFFKTSSNDYTPANCTVHLNGVNAVDGTPE